jgi:hypothetical protein
MARSNAHIGDTLLTTEQHAANRRKTQRRRQVNRTSSPTPASPRDKQEALRAEHLQFRRKQAALAITLLPEDLKDLALKVAYGILEVFPALELSKGEKRLEKCVTTVTRWRLSPAENLRTGAIDLGLAKASVALDEARKRIKPSKKSA